MAVPVSAQQLMPLLMIDNTKSNSSSNPYLVTSAADLSLIAQAVSGGSDLSGVYFRQTTAISLEGTSFSGIGTAALPFRGTYDGGGHGISGYSLTGGDSVGLFRYVGNGAVIKNVKASGKVSVESRMNGIGGGLVGSAVGVSISGCSFDGTVTVIAAATAYAGGIVGKAESSTLSSVTNTGTIAAMNGAMVNASGGIAGYMKGGSVNAGTNKGAVGASDGTQAAAAGIVGSISGVTIENYTVNSGSISVDTGERIAECLVYAAGIAALGDSSASKIVNAKNTGAITATSSSQLSRQYVGGITASAGRTTISYSENAGSVSAENGGMIYVGGIAASTASSITSCTSYGPSVSAAGGTYIAIGGIAGESASDIKDSTTSGSLMLKSLRTSGGYMAPANIGGIVGTSSNGTIDGCVSSMNISGAGSTGQAVIYGGGIAGALTGKIVNSAAAGDIALSGTQDIAGGIVGMMNHSASLRNSYALGAVKGGYAGLIAGYLAGTTANCYSAGSASGSGQNIAGVRDSKASAEYCYWLAANVNSQLQTSYSSLLSGKFAVFTDRSGVLYSLTNGVDVFGTKAATLLEALNAWVASGTNSNEASYWAAPSGNTNNGYPTFGKAPGNSVSVSTNGVGGTVTSDKKFASQGETVTLTVSPNAGYRLASLTVNGSAVTVSDTVKTYSFIMPNGNVSVKATFERRSAIGQGEYHITIGSLTNGSIKVDKTTAKKGDIVKVTVTPMSGYRLSSGTLKYNNTEIKMSASGYSFTMPGENVTITAKFINGRGFTVKAAANLENGTIIP
nr:hypothetical protein [Clostridia bacterium]